MLSDSTTISLTTTSLTPTAGPRRSLALLGLLLLLLGASAAPRAVLARAGDDGSAAADGDAPVPARLIATPVTALALAQTTIVNPGAEAARRSQEAAAVAEAANRDSEAADLKRGRRSTYEMEPIVVQGEPLPRYRTDELIGDYAQPRWTAQRLFPGTRVYVIPKGEVDIEQWFRFETPKNGGPTTVTTQSEIEFGLPHRLQLDLYATQMHDTGVAGSGSTGASAEIRYAFADWGKLFGNPAIYLEYTTLSGQPDLVEGKLLLGDALAPGWHWGVNLSVEQQTSGTRTTEKQFTAGVSRTVIDHQLDLGLETRLGWTDARGSRGHYARDLQVGPSLRVRPLPQMHIDFAPLFGTTSDSMKVNSYVIFGWEF